MERRSIKRLVLPGWDGEFVDASGTVVAKIGRWRLICDQTVHHLQAQSEPEQRVAGLASLRLDAGRPMAGNFRGQLALPTGEHITVTLELDGTLRDVNRVTPDQAAEALTRSLERSI